MSSTALTSSSSRILISLAFVLLVITVFVVHAVAFVKLNMVTIDSDQPYMWLGASDFSKGNFYEPRYYAQDYNTFMEALFAVPFMWLHVPVYYAVPLATHFIALFPFLFTAFYFFFHDKKIQALLVLFLVLCLPAEYDLLTSLPRGFVTGLFFCSFFVISLLNPYDLRFIALNTLLALTGYFVNPNSVVLTAPFLFYIFLHHVSNWRYWLLTLACLCFVIPLYLFFDRFYKAHPDYVMNDIHYQFSTAFFMDAVSNLDKRFGHLSFFIANNCLTLLFVLFALGVALFHSNKKAFAALWVFIAVLLFSFCSGKTSEGSAWAYMSYGRMYLAIPLFIGLFTGLLELPPKRWILTCVCIPLVFSAHKLVKLEKLLEWQYEPSHYHGVKLFSLKSTLEIIDFYKGICKDERVDFLLISNRFWLNNVACYGGPAVCMDYPSTQETKLEKRYWVRAKNKGQVFTKFIFSSSTGELDKLLPKHHFFKLEKMDDYGLFRVKENTLKTEDFINFVNLYEPY